MRGCEDKVTPFLNLILILRLLHQIPRRGLPVPRSLLSGLHGASFRDRRTIPYYCRGLVRCSGRSLFRGNGTHRHSHRLLHDEALGLYSCRSDRLVSPVPLWIDNRCSVQVLGTPRECFEAHGTAVQEEEQLRPLRVQLLFASNLWIEASEECPR